MSISKKRQEMGEEAWAEYQKQRNIDKSRKSYIKRAINCQGVTDWRRRTKKDLVEYKGRQCENCGFETDCYAVYHFHHFPLFFASPWRLIFLV